MTKGEILGLLFGSASVIILIVIAAIRLFVDGEIDDAGGRFGPDDWRSDNSDDAV
jgi:hypothetical protein